jgi:hypothetical protein
MRCALSRPRFPRIRAPPSGRNLRRAARVLAGALALQTSEGTGLMPGGFDPPALRFSSRPVLPPAAGSAAPRRPYPRLPT